jgi:hypothetical protein
MTPDNLRDVLAQKLLDSRGWSVNNPTRAQEKACYRDADALAPTVARLIADARPVDCDGSNACESKWHVHGCYGDTGQCDDPLDHPGYERGRAEQAAADRERVVSVPRHHIPWANFATCKTEIAEVVLWSDLRAALDSEGGA